jgi:hypothetical protein
MKTNVLANSDKPIHASDWSLWQEQTQKRIQPKFRLLFFPSWLSPASLRLALRPRSLFVLTWSIPFSIQISYKKSTQAPVRRAQFIIRVLGYLTYIPTNVIALNQRQTRRPAITAERRRLGLDTTIDGHEQLCFQPADRMSGVEDIGRREHSRRNRGSRAEYQ